MSRAYHGFVGANVIALMNDFLRTYFRHVSQPSATYVLAELDLAFLRYWHNVHRQHHEHAACVQCKDFQDCGIGDALSVLRPDAISGVSNRFHRYVFAIGTYDVVSNYGEIHLDRIRR